jgi:hypothetical protein
LDARFSRIRPLAMVGVSQALPNTALWHRWAWEQRLLNFLPSRPIEEIAQEFVDAFSPKSLGSFW